MLVTVPEAAAKAGRNAETIRRWIRSGRLRSQKVGTQHLVDEAELMAIVDDGPIDLPDSWRLADGGRMPEWEQLVRDGRSSH